MKSKFTLSVIILICLCLKRSLAQDKTPIDSIISFGKVHVFQNNQEIPIKIWNDLILVEAEVDGHKGTFIWDNGFTITGLDKKFAKSLGIKPIKNDDVNAIDGNNNNVKLAQSIAPNIKVGGIEIKQTPVTFVDMTSIISTKNEQIIGLIGASIINKLNWKFNFDKNTLIVSSKKFIDSGIILKVNVNPYNNAHTMPFKLNNATFDAVIDFGFNDDDFSATKQLGQEFANNTAALVVGSTSISVSGISNFDTSWIISKNYTYLLDNKHFNYLPHIFLTDNENGFRLGNRFFRRYNLIVNMNDSTYILSPRKTPIDEVIFKSFGAKILLENGKMFVGQLISNPNVDGKEIQIKEEVISINDKTAKDFDGLIDLIDYQKSLLKSNEPMKLKMIDNRTFIFTPKENIEL